MKRTNIYLDERQLSLLRGLGKQRGLPVAVLVRHALDEWLASQGIRFIEENEWERRFGALLARRQDVASRAGFQEDAVQQDVEQAVKEVRRAQAARRH